MEKDGAYDVVVLGSGIAGLSGALAAHELGLRPLVIEKSEKLGGGTTNSYGLIWIGNNHLAQEAGVADSRDDVISYMRFLGGGSHDEERMLASVDRGPEALKFFADCGIGFHVVSGLTDHYYGTAPGGHAHGRSVEVDLISGFDLGEWQHRVQVPEDVPCFVTAEEQIGWGGINRFSEWDKDLVRERKEQDMRGKGLGLICHFVKAVTERGIPILTGKQIDRLTVADGRVTGVRLDSGETITATKGVLLGTGGYSASAALNWELEQIPGIGQDPSSLALPSITGDGLVYGGEIGGVIYKIENSLRVMLSYTIAPDKPGETPVCVHAGIVELCSPHTMLVNKHGKRFADETFFQGIVPHLRHFDPVRHEHANLPAYLIFDSQYLAKFSFANEPVGSPVPASLTRADSIEALAGKLGIDAGPLGATIKRFNGFVEAGADPDFHRGENQWKLASAKTPRGVNATLGAIDTPPYFGIQLHPSAPGSVGLLSDENGQVVHLRRHKIPGLYASGNVAAATEFAIGYQAGLSLAGSMTFSYLAVKHMLSGG
jgi:3-oxosteroid 1-dehydrogenase